MKAALLYEKEDVRIVDIPTPSVGPTDILIRVRAAKICPTDIRKYKLGSKDARIQSLPTNLCHEYTGEIVDKGELVQRYDKGMRVVGYGFGGNAEYAKVNILQDYPYYFESIVELPPNVSFEEGTFVTPLAENIHSVVDQAGCRFGDTIIIIGSGPMGLMQVNVAHWCGARVIAVDLDDSRLEIAKEFGADYTINPSNANVVEYVKKFNDGKLADCSVATVGVPSAIKQAIDATKVGGRVVLFGGAEAGTSMLFDPNDVHYYERMVVGCEGIGLAPNFHVEKRLQAVRHIADHKIDVKRLMTHIIPLEDIVKGYELIEKKQALSVVAIP